MATNKVVYGNTVLLDLSNDTLTASKLELGYTAHDRGGNLITGTLEPQTPTETELWANPSTSSNFSANKVVTLSDDISNYSLLKFTWKCRTSDDDSTAVAAYISPTDLIACGDYASTANKPKFTIGSRTSGIHARMISATSNTTIKFQGAAALNASGVVANEAIPIKIIGISGVDF